MQYVVTGYDTADERLRCLADEIYRAMKSDQSGTVETAARMLVKGANMNAPARRWLSVVDGGFGAAK